MEIDKNTYELLASYLSGNISSDEKIFVENWIAQSEQNKQLFEEVQKLWQSSGIRLQTDDIDSAQLLDDLRARIAESNSSMGRVIAMIRPFKTYWQVAAGISVLLISYFLLPKQTTENAIAEQQITIEAGDKVTTIYLPDSSKVWMNVKSRITYPKSFTARNVTLDGEAYFQVKKDTIDFTVTTDHTVTRVLGTSFNLKEEGDTIVTLTVSEGTVRFSKRDSAETGGLIINARQKAIFKQQSKLYKGENNNPSFTAWRKVNNPIFEAEKGSPEKFLINTFSTRKNQINQTVIEGTIKNNATLAAYKKITLDVNYTKPNGKRVAVVLTISETVYPGQRLPYRKRLLDILSESKAFTVKIKSAQTE